MAVQIHTLTMSDTLFAKIARREAPARIVYQDDDVTAFHDINPVAPTHILIVPNETIRTLNDATPDDERLLGKMMLIAQRLAREMGIAEGGYRVVMNCNRDGGQTVYHLHLHLLGGRRMTWPPG
jgi:histidine triad (HIT) family protein